MLAGVQHQQPVAVEVPAGGGAAPAASGGGGAPAGGGAAPAAGGGAGSPAGGGPPAAAAVVVPQAEVPRRLSGGGAAPAGAGSAPAPAGGRSPAAAGGGALPLPAPRGRNPEELVEAATATGMPMIEGSISKWAGQSSGGVTTEEFGTGRSGTSGADDGTSTASAGAGSKPRLASFGCAANATLQAAVAAPCAGRQNPADVGFCFLAAYISALVGTRLVAPP